MRKKIVILGLLFATWVVLPIQSYADAAETRASTTVAAKGTAIQPRRKGNRGRHLGWYKGRRAYWYARNPYDRRYVRQVYYINGRPHVRWIWMY